MKAITVPQRSLYERLITDFRQATCIRILVSFLMESGVRMVLPELKAALDRGVPVSILTGRYLGVTEPSALYLLKNALGDFPNFSLRLFPEGTVSFHPKAYFVDLPSGKSVYIGSSNLSSSALQFGYEWNYCLNESDALEDYRHFLQTFEALFDQSELATDEVVAQYAARWKPSCFQRHDAENKSGEAAVIPQPRGVQEDILYYLNAARKEGVKKGLVVAATGIGKTYLAAFDSQTCPRVLFIAHRKEILEKAMETFLKVRPHASCGLLVDGKQDIEADLLFASVQSLGTERYLDPAVLPPDRFDYIVMDEFHHAAAPSYAKVLEFFKPKTFMLGLTATPFRTDNRDILGLCDDTIVFELYLKEAVQRGLLAPFRYYAFYDETDYEAIPSTNGSYDIEALEDALSRGARSDYVIARYRLFAGRCALGFCAGIRHVEAMVTAFRAAGIAAAGLVSSPTPGSDAFLPRGEAIAALQSGKVSVLFTVDMFNEGVDIPEVDMVLFLRPTESPVVFLQQLGRGLRLFPGKEKVTVLDFIGNYHRAHWVPALLAGDNPRHLFEVSRSVPLPHEVSYPEGCEVQFDFKLIELFEVMRKNDPLQKRLDAVYQELCRDLGRRPTRLETYHGSDLPFSLFLREGGWLRFLETKQALAEEEKAWLDTPAEAFLRYLETTLMTKSYKMPVVAAFIAGGTWRGQIDFLAMEDAWNSFYTDERKSFEERSTWGNLKALLKSQPIRALSSTGSAFFEFDEINYRFSLKDEIKPYLTPALLAQAKDILQWRTAAYFARKLRGGDGRHKKGDMEGIS